MTVIAATGVFAWPTLMPNAAVWGSTDTSPKYGTIRTIGTVVLDPGHGGHNQGARGDGGLTEKDVCLSFARMLATALETKGYAVVLTRSADYDVPLRNRTAIANHHKADLFISLHTAASYLHSVEGIAIHYYQPPSEPAKVRQPPPGHGNRGSMTWRQIQLGHEAQSRELAQTMAQKLTVVWSSTPVQVDQSPLVVLEGADMAAVLIEIGHLTHPATEKNLGNATYLATFAQTLVQSVDTYFSIRPPSQAGP